MRFPEMASMTPERQAAFLGVLSRWNGAWAMDVIGAHARSRGGSWVVARVA